MKKFLKKCITTGLSLVLVCSFALGTVAELEFEGDFGTGGGSSSVATNNSYSTNAYMTDDNAVAGYRFSLVDSKGTLVPYGSKYCIADVLCSTFTNVYSTANGSGTHWTTDAAMKNKTEWTSLVKAQSTISFSTCVTRKNYPRKNDDDFTNKLPYVPSEMEKYMTKEGNVNNILTNVFDTAYKISDLASNQYSILCEPIFLLNIDGTRYAFTATEIAVYGYVTFGGTTKIDSSSTPGSWGYISNYTNAVWQSRMFVSEARFNWSSGARARKSSNDRETFGNLLAQGYGVAIVSDHQNDKPEATPIIVRPGKEDPGTKVEEPKDPDTPPNKDEDEGTHTTGETPADVTDPSSAAAQTAVILYTDAARTKEVPFGALLKEGVTYYPTYVYYNSHCFDVLCNIMGQNYYTGKVDFNKDIKFCKEHRENGEAFTIHSEDGEPEYAHK